MLVQHFIHQDYNDYETYVKVSKYGMGAISTFYGTLGFGLNFLPLFAFSFFMELVWAPQNRRREPGDFGDPLGIGMYTPSMRTAELTNGRFAMISCIVIFAV